ncbi:hypothetical protein BJ912DRAFT_1071700 [Pholiota molesta]|nr:hypothetical protein BJ912DRAFT_1071700 [Pholiota molesta]
MPRSTLHGGGTRRCQIDGGGFESQTPSAQEHLNGTAIHARHRPVALAKATLRSANGVGYTSYSDNALYDFSKKAVENGFGTQSNGNSNPQSRRSITWQERRATREHQTIWLVAPTYFCRLEL